MDHRGAGDTRYLLARQRYARWNTKHRRVTVLCPWCGEPVPDGQGELHHWLLKRSAVARAHTDRINVPENLILVHHACHLRFGQTREMFERCRAEALLAFTEEELTAFHNSLADVGVRPVTTILDL